MEKLNDGCTGFVCCVDVNTSAAVVGMQPSTSFSVLMQLTRIENRKHSRDTASVSAGDTNEPTDEDAAAVAGDWVTVTEPQQVLADSSRDVVKNPRKTFYLGAEDTISYSTVQCQSDSVDVINLIGEVAHIYQRSTELSDNISTQDNEDHGDNFDGSNQQRNVASCAEKGVSSQSVYSCSVDSDSVATSLKALPYTWSLVTHSSATGFQRVSVLADASVTPADDDTEQLSFVSQVYDITTQSGDIYSYSLHRCAACFVCKLLSALVHSVSHEHYHTSADTTV